MKTLISMTDFVLQVVQTPNINEAICWEQTQQRLDKIYQYSLFLKQPLKLEMFVPCDEGNVLEKPTQAKYGWYSADSQEEESGWMYKEGEDEYYRQLRIYGNAKERIVFEGFDVFNSATKNPDIINRNLGIIICFNSIISVMIEGVNGYGGFSDSKILIEQLSQYNLELTPTALKQIGL